MMLSIVESTRAVLREQLLSSPGDQHPEIFRAVSEALTSTTRMDPTLAANTVRALTISIADEIGATCTFDRDGLRAWFAAHGGAR